MLASQFATDCYERMAARRPSADDGEAFPPHNNTSTMRTFLTSGTLCIALGLGFWYALTSTLDDITLVFVGCGVSNTGNNGGASINRGSCGVAVVAGLVAAVAAAATIVDATVITTTVVVVTSVS